MRMRNASVKISLLLFTALVLVAGESFLYAGRAVAVERVSYPGKYEGYSKDKYLFSRTRSTYVTMRDGVKIAVDYTVPVGIHAGEKFPAILVQTRYWRAMVINIMPDPAKKYLSRHGYAVVSVDVRGTGASFGTWRYPWAEEEVKDGADIVDWIISQPWSDGSVGAYGNSYVGATAEFLLVNKHPAVKASVIRYSLFDSYTDIAYSGGIHHDWFMDGWNRADQALDANDVGTLLEMMGFKVPFAGVIPGVKPVGYPWRGRKMLKKAIEDHKNNGDIYAESLLSEFRDDYSENWQGTIEQMSPYAFVDDMEASGAAIYSYTGWYDGYYTRAGVNRYLNVSNCEKLIIGPWPHSGKEDISPWRESREVKFDHNAELLRFFDYHLKGIDNGIMDEPPVWYYTMGEEKWKSGDTWPPASRTTTYYFSEEHKLTTDKPSERGAHDVYKVDYTTGSGNTSRYNSLLNLESNPIGYPDRAEADKKLLVYETEPLPRDIEVTGHPMVSLYVSSTADDGQFFVYLEDVSPGDTVSYVTEGMLRAACREISKEKPLYKMPPGAPHHTFKRADAKPLIPGKVALITFDLQPTSVLFMKGHRIRVAIAGADKDHYALPKVEEPVLKFYRDPSHPSSIDLPVVERE